MSYNLFLAKFIELLKTKLQAIINPQHLELCSISIFNQGFPFLEHFKVFTLTL